MKKLMFAAAIAASAAAFADPITNSIGFAGYDLGAKFTTGQAELDETRTPKAAEYGYFLFAGDSDSSVVTNENPSTTKHTAFFASAQDFNYLALDTEGGTLWRSINTLVPKQNEDGYNLGTAREVAATGTYLDTLVQFTVTEDEAPTVGDDDKLAIWLQAGEGETNLMVRAMRWYMNGDEPANEATNFVVSGVSILPGEWYRLTVKAIQTTTTQYYNIPAFQIFIDGNPVVAAEPQFATDLQTGFGGIWASGMGELASANKLFPSLAGAPANLTDVTLQGVGFQGTGAVDEIVWTEDDPFPAAVINFTLTRSIGENVTAVDFTIGEDAISFENDAASIVSNATVTIAAPTFAEGYQLAALTVGGTAVENPEFPYSFTMTADTTVAITAALIPAAYPEYVGEDTKLRTQYNTWKATNGADSESEYEKQFLLNVAPSTTVADDALVIDSITEVQGGWDIVVSTTVTGAALSDGSNATYNGYLLVKAANDLAGLATATPTAYTVTPAADGKVKITVTAGKFMKAVLTTTAPAAPSAGE